MSPLSARLSQSIIMTRTRLASARQTALALLLFALTGTVAADVDTAWVRWYHAPYNGMDFGTALALDPQGNVIVASKNEGSEGNFDVAILKYNPAGELLWESRYDGPACDWDYPRTVAVDPRGNVYTAGASINLVAEERDMLTLKYSPDGELLWTARHAGPSHDWDEATDIALDDSGNVYVTGWESCIDLLCRYVTIKYDSAGNEQWAATYQEKPDPFDRAWAIAVAPDGSRIFVTGESARETGGYDLATVCYSRDGNEKWVARVNGGKGTAIAPDGAGGVYVGGRSGSNASPLTIIRYDSTGAQRWIARYIGPPGLGGSVEALAVDRRGHVYGTGVVILQYPDYDFATLKFDSTGSEHWVRLWGGTAGGMDCPFAIALDSAGNAFVTGESFTGPGVSVYECVTVKYDPRGVEQWVARYTTGFGSGGSGSDVVVDELGHVYVTGYMIRNAGAPVDAMTIKYVETPGGVVGPGVLPSHGRLPPTLIRGKLMLAPGIGRAELLDLSGRVVIPLSPGQNDIRHLAPGVYFVRETSGVERGASRVRKVIIAD